MAYFDCSFKSKYLQGRTDITVVLPIGTGREIFVDGDIYDFEGNFQTLFLLHGGSDDHTDWIHNSNVERYANKNKVALVIPRVELSFYNNMAYGNRYWDYVSEELPRFVRKVFPLSDKREDNFVAGLSMGGYGALKLALRMPDCFSACASFSGALDVNSLAQDPPLFNKNIMINTFGDISNIEGSDNDLFYLLSKRVREGIKLPKMLLTCGYSDFLHEINIKFVEHARILGVNLDYEEWRGDHDWYFWEESIQRAFDWFEFKHSTVI